MSAVLNDRDAILQAASVRIIVNGLSAQVQEALAAAAAAQAAANVANTAILDMARDDLLSPSEKPAESLRWAAIVSERPGIDASATALGITTERTAYANAYSTLNTYITSLGTQFATIPGTAISIVGATYRTNFKNYYDAKQALLNAIAAKSSTVAQWAGVGGAGKPADNASADLTLLGYGTVSVSGNRAVKSSGVAAWDSSATSKESYVGGAYVSVRTDGMSDLLFGLNSDPDTDSHWSSLDFAMELQRGGVLAVHESGVARGAVGAYGVGDILAVVYDGSAVRYCKNGIVQYTTILPAPITAPLFFDSSINTVGAALSNIRLGPLSSNNWAAIGGNGKPENGATVGAPAGTNVAGVPAETVVEKANNAVATTPGFALNFSFDGDVAGASGSTLVCGFRVNPTGYTGSYSARWTISRRTGGPTSQGPFLSAASGNVISASASASNGTITYEVTVIVTHSGGLTATASGAASFTFGNL